MQISLADQKQIARITSNPEVGNPRTKDTGAFVDLQRILEKAAAPNQLLIATSSTMGAWVIAAAVPASNAGGYNRFHVPS